MLQIQDLLLAFFHKINSNLKEDFQTYFKEMKNFYLGAALGISQGGSNETPELTKNKITYNLFFYLTLLK